MTKKEIIQRFEDIGVIHKEPVKLRSGETAGFYCDIKKAYGYPDVLNALADEIGKLLEKDITCVAACGYGGLPLAALVAARGNKKFIAVRDKPKSQYFHTVTHGSAKIYCYVRILPYFGIIKRTHAENWTKLQSSF